MNALNSSSREPVLKKPNHSKSELGLAQVKASHELSSTISYITEVENHHSCVTQQSSKVRTSQGTSAQSTVSNNSKKPIKLQCQIIPKENINQYTFKESSDAEKSKHLNTSDLPLGGKHGKHRRSVKNGTVNENISQGPFKRLRSAISSGSPPCKRIKSSCQKADQECFEKYKDNVLPDNNKSFVFSEEKSPVLISSEEKYEKKGNYLVSPVEKSDRQGNVPISSGELPCTNKNSLVSSGSEKQGSDPVSSMEMSGRQTNVPISSEELPGTNGNITASSLEKSNSKSVVHISSGESVKNIIIEISPLKMKSSGRKHRSSGGSDSSDLQVISEHIVGKSKKKKKHSNKIAKEDDWVLKQPVSDKDVVLQSSLGQEKGLHRSLTPEKTGVIAKVHPELELSCDEVSSSDQTGIQVQPGSQSQVYIMHEICRFILDS